MVEMVSNYKLLINFRRKPPQALLDIIKKVMIQMPHINDEDPDRGVRFEEDGDELNIRVNVYDEQDYSEPIRTAHYMCEAFEVGLPPVTPWAVHYFAFMFHDVATRKEYNLKPTMHQDLIPLKDLIDIVRPVKKVNYFATVEECDLFLKSLLTTQWRTNETLRDPNIYAVMADPNNLQPVYHQEYSWHFRDPEDTHNNYVI